MQDLQCVGDDSLARRCNVRKDTAIANEYLEPKLGLQQLELPADRRLGGGEGRCGSSDIEFVLRHGGHESQLLKFHGAPRSAANCSRRYSRPPSRTRKRSGGAICAISAKSSVGTGRLVSRSRT
jgi:hypothetical protein